MLTFSFDDAVPRRSISRRNFVRAGALGMAGWTLADSMYSKSLAAGEPSVFKDKSVIFIYLAGGPPAHETFDPKTKVSDSYASLFGQIPTKLPGVTFGSHFPKLASLADKLAIVRNFQTGTAAHDGGTTLLTSANPSEATLGAVHAAVSGVVDSTTGIPNHLMVTGETFGLPSGRTGAGVLGGLQATGSLSPSLGPLHPIIEGDAKQSPKRNSRKENSGLLSDMQLHLTKERFGQRKSLLAQLDGLRRKLDSDESIARADDWEQRASDLLLAGSVKAFDIRQEDPRVFQRYDTSHIQTPPEIYLRSGFGKSLGKAWSPETLGMQLLLARRLCESGCGFVTVVNQGWDFHNVAAFALDDGMPVLGPALDHAVSALLLDLEARGLSDDVLVVMTGEMGRTPTTNIKNGRIGRDHWAKLAPLVVAGGGLKMGQVIGSSDRQGGEPATTPYTPEHFMGTIMHSLFDIGQLRLARHLPPNLLNALTAAPPIKELFG